MSLSSCKVSNWFLRFERPLTVEEAAVKYIEERRYQDAITVLNSKLPSDVRKLLQSGNISAQQYVALLKQYLGNDKDFITLRLGSLDRAGHTGPAGRPAEVDSGEDAREEPHDPAAWSRLEVVRRPTPDGARYFGPYHSATAARRTLHLVNKHFQLRTCRDTEFVARKRPCLQHQIKRCPAPCVYPVDRGFYGEQVDAVAKFLEGRHDELTRELSDRMKSAAQHMRFELAGIYRDQLRAIEKVREEQRVVTIDDIHRDVVGFYREGDLVEIALLHVRAGKLADVGTYPIKQAEIPDEEIVAAFLAQHYGPSLSERERDLDGSGAGSGSGDEGSADGRSLVMMPDEVILPREPEGMEGIAEWLSDRAGHKVALLVPKRGHRVDLVNMANDNARHAFAEKRREFLLNFPAIKELPGSSEAK